LEHFAPNDRVCIVTGPRIDLSEDLIARFKGLFREQFPNDRTQSTVAFLNGVKVEAFPSHHVDTMRGLDNVKFIISDESDYYPLFQQKEVRAVMEGYIGKPNSNPTIVLVSTPKAPGGLMQQIELEQDSLYHKLFFDYHYGLQGPYPIYSEEQIRQARLSPEFGREYRDFAICATQLVDGKIQVIEASEYQRPNFTDMIQKIWQLKQQYGHVSNIYVDAANPEVWQDFTGQAMKSGKVR
jgi:hypothetical protein